MNNDFAIGRHSIGPEHPTYFVADLAANHDGSLERAKKLIHLCAEAGANAAKFQNFKAQTIVSDHGFRSLGSQQSHQAAWKKSVYEVYQDASIPMDWTKELKQTCDEAGIDYFTSPYDLSLLDELSKYVCAWKVGSGDITWPEIIEAMASRHLPILIATGASDMDDVRRAVAAARKYEKRIVLMQCNTNYTGSLENFSQISLNVLKAYALEFPDVVLGISDHTPGSAVVLGAVTLGARVVEKHFTDDRGREGPDHAFSMSPSDWRDMVDRTRELEAALGTEDKHVMKNEEQTMVLQRRAIRAARPIGKGKRIEAADLIPLRPCPLDALPPYRLGELIGRAATHDIPEGECVRLSDIR
jgi:N-acetylneuraminate synthase